MVVGAMIRFLETVRVVIITNTQYACNDLSVVNVTFRPTHATSHACWSLL